MAFTSNAKQLCGWYKEHDDEKPDPKLSRDFYSSKRSKTWKEINLNTEMWQQNHLHNIEMAQSGES